MCKMEYALLIDSYRVSVKPKPIFGIDNFAYLCGLALFIIPFTKLSYYFTFVTFGYILLVLLFLTFGDLGILTLKFNKEETTDNQVKLKIIYKKKLSFNIGLNFEAFNFSLLPPNYFSEKKNLNHFLSPPDPG